MTSADGPDEQAEPAPPTPAQRASEQARVTGERVEVVEERTEDELVFANPDGSFTSEITAGPQRVQQPDGAWRDVDPTLERRPDGSVGPKVSAIDLSFSGGPRQAGSPGSESSRLVRLGDGGKAMVIDWPKVLPRPTLEGRVATYHEVLPGVDLKMRASTTGYSYVLVVKKAPTAATTRELAHLSMSVRGEGVEVRENADGGIEAVDSTGAAVFSGSEPSMWDSTRPTLPPPSKDSPDGLPAQGQAKPLPTEGPSGDGDVSAAPVSTSQVGDVGLSVADGKLTVVPDTSLLVDADTVYPVYIDPNASVNKTDWLYVSSAHASTEYHKFDDDEGVGRCSTWNGYVCSTRAFTNRMYFKFVPVEKDWNERVVTDVTFRVYETWSFSCTASWVDLSWVDPAKVNSGTNWNNKPADGDLMVDRKVAYGRGKSCNPDAPASWVEFSDNKEESNENLTSTVKSKLASGSPIAFSLSAKDEDDGNSWKRFRGDNASLAVTYNTRPGKPFNERLTDPNHPCATGANRPYVWNDPPNLVASAKDPDSQNISINFHLTDVTANKVVQNTKVGPKAHTDSEKKAVDFKAAVTPANFVHGHIYRWNSRSNDGKYDSVSFSDWCEYGVDKERPNVPPTVSSADFPTDGAVRKPGEFGKVLFSANGVKDSAYGNDVEYYEWAVGNDNPTNKTYPATVGGDAEETKVAATSFGPNVLYVRSVDRAGNRSDVVRYVFGAVRPCDDPATDACAAAVYLLDEAAGTTAADSSGKGRTLTLSGVERSDGQRVSAGEITDRALRFAGGADFGTASSAVDTRNGFTVTAWVRPSALTADFTVMSQAGTNGSGFALSFNASLKRWTFGRHTSDKTSLAGADYVQAVDGDIQAPVVGKWTHLAGIFNPGNNKLSIYVDGKEKGTATYTGTVWNAAGGLQLGRSRLNDKWVNFFNGDIDDVRIFPGGLDPADIDDLWYRSRPLTN